jgi:hypothetical protein
LRIHGEQLPWSLAAVTCVAGKPTPFLISSQGGRMGIMDSAKDMLGGAKDQVDGAVDSAADMVKEKTPDQVDGAVDQGAEMAKDEIDKHLA